MKQLIISIVLAVCLVGCGEKPKFSISEGDTQEAYANNPAFTKVVLELPSASNLAIGYEFTGTPATIYGNIETGDLDILGGYATIDTNQKTLYLSIKGKASFDKLVYRINNSNFNKGSVHDKVLIGKKYELGLSNKGVLVFITYDPFADWTTLTFTIDQRLKK